MITSVKMEAFRGVRDGGVEGLAPISILVGPNNSGKSTVLEALAVVGLGDRANEIVSLLLRRGGPLMHAIAQIINQSANQATLEAYLSDGNDAKRIVSALTSHTRPHPVEWPMVRSAGLKEPIAGVMIKRTGRSSTAYVDASGGFSPLLVDDGHGIVTVASLPPNFPVQLVDVEAVRAEGALENAYSAIEKANKVNTVVRALQRSMSGLTDLRILKAGPDFILHTVYANGSRIPAYVAGDGFKRFLELAAAALSTPQGVVLLEEPESYQHPRYLQELATLLHLAAKQGTQIILSTHSIELIDLLLHAPEADGLTYPAVHRMGLFEGQLRATSIDHEKAIIARDELLEDLRA